MNQLLSCKNMHNPDGVFNTLPDGRQARRGIAAAPPELLTSAIILLLQTGHTSVVVNQENP
jgi:hypothetical protein